VHRLQRGLPRAAVSTLTVVVVALYAGLAGALGPSARHAGDGGGGTVTIAAEQEPDCADWIASCAGSAWGTWTYSVHTLPRPFDQIGGKYVPKVSPSWTRVRRSRSRTRSAIGPNGATAGRSRRTTSSTRGNRS
jgi:hypothetical protein